LISKRSFEQLFFIPGYLRGLSLVIFEVISVYRARKLGYVSDISASGFFPFSRFFSLYPGFFSFSGFILVFS